MAEKENDDIDKTQAPESDDSSDDISSDSLVPEEILEGIPEEDRGKIAHIVKQTMISGVMRRGNPVADKITEEHITQLITKSDEQDKRDREERKGERNYNFRLAILGLAFAIFLIVFLRENIDLLINFIIAVVSFVGGFGFGKTRKGKNE